jgi:hypothetical protein
MWFPDLSGRHSRASLIKSFAPRLPTAQLLDRLSARASETNTNYGNILSLFDRAMGTFTPSARAEFVDCGLEGYDGDEVQRFGGLLRLPFRRRGAAAASN